MFKLKTQTKVLGLIAMVMVMGLASIPVSHIPAVKAEYGVWELQTEVAVIESTFYGDVMIAAQLWHYFIYGQYQFSMVRFEWWSAGLIYPFWVGAKLASVYYGGHLKGYYNNPYANYGVGSWQTAYFVTANQQVVTVNFKGDFGIFSWVFHSIDWTTRYITVKQ